MRKKNRLTITLPKDLLSKIDSNIDGSTIRNRSHAIESLIRQSLKNPIETAIILAGNKTPSKTPTLKVINGKPAIFHTVEKIVEAGIKNILICGAGYNQQIKKIVKDGSSLNAIVKYIPENTPLGTAGAIKKAQKHIKGDNFLVIHGDIVTKLNLNTFISFHTQENTLATIAVKPRKTETSYGKVLIEGNQITDFFDKFDSKGIDIINAGIYLFKSNIFTYIKPGKSKLETDIFPILAKQEQLTAYIFQGIWYDISKPADYQAALSRLKKIIQ
jgi:NDP-sugar pyrophosphorylase family protein